MDDECYPETVEHPIQIHVHSPAAECNSRCHVVAYLADVPELTPCR